MFVAQCATTVRRLALSRPQTTSLSPETPLSLVQSLRRPPLTRTRRRTQRRPPRLRLKLRTPNMTRSSVRNVYGLIEHCHSHCVNHIVVRRIMQMYHGFGNQITINVLPSLEHCTSYRGKNTYWTTVRFLC